MYTQLKVIQLLSSLVERMDCPEALLGRPASPKSSLSKSTLGNRKALMSLEPGGGKSQRGGVVNRTWKRSVG
ncbi:uncharacterized protein PHALS_07413 [Plasmopara halstedii]|uniref:Uncharacterized protein n=1 Tax=Plasmopara halstedii TaxID=4781 RepID=A0A0P1B4H6_PLAHL|nr:uncharacterized protein PHALS_07413 [Plasmopara halstedii]CEG49661.1 hypothetical protein PHALS_07413 [Plasmopara halstedii]|eukprot:XP_024586030.1 hypothetical protein PHALS_07413 [Plasmopara halstedii]